MGFKASISLQSLNWTGGLDWWTGLVDWTGGLDWWTGLVDWTGGLDWWTGLVDWTGELTFFVLKSLLCSLVRPHSPVGLDMMHFSLYKPGLTILSV